MTDAARAPRLPVVLLWHLHQPHYRDAITGEYLAPWTTLHALKDYSDMAAHLEAEPNARAVVNFTPVLLEQLAELASQIARHLGAGADLPDPVLAPLSDVPLPESPDRRLELLNALTRAQRQRMIEPLPVFRELVDLTLSLATPERIAYASDELITDLAVWYHLAWTGESLRRGDSRVAALMAHGRGFRLEHRRVMLAVIADTLAQLVPRYRALSDAGRCELSTSPYGHPILPLLCDFAAARDSLPDSPLPDHASYPGGAERARWHLAEAVRVFEANFGRRPAGCWPSEGAVSDAALELIAEAGFGWVASSANVLRASLSAAGLGEVADGSRAFNRAYEPRGARVACWFRHDSLSDLVGFTYSTWHGDHAVQDLVRQLVELRDHYAPGEEHAVLIALDGENAWEHYPQNGWHFLRALYATLAEHPALELTTLGELTRRGRPPGRLPRLVAGSWVHGTLSTWIGDAAKNRAWDLLCEAKSQYDRVIAAGALDADRCAAAGRQLASCESSDWFWWFGDYNPPEVVAQFDRLYRTQLTALYRLLSLPCPASLAVPLSGGGGAPEQGGVMRRAHAV